MRERRRWMLSLVPEWGSFYKNASPAGTSFNGNRPSDNYIQAVNLIHSLNAIVTESVIAFHTISGNFCQSRVEMEYSKYFIVLIIRFCPNSKHSQAMRHQPVSILHCYSCSAPMVHTYIWKVFASARREQWRLKTSIHPGNQHDIDARGVAGQEALKTRGQQEGPWPWCATCIPTTGSRTSNYRNIVMLQVVK